jgi:hypothetical protein
MSRTAETTADRQGNQPQGQLRLLAGEKRAKRPTRPEWVLDERTRRIGREGVEAIRETLRRAEPPEPVKQAS